MKAVDKSFCFLTTQSYYDIPFFQRAYVWTEENWSELFQNLTTRSQNHFLGSIILKNQISSSGEIPRFSVIDGQQRLTTLSILLRACFDHIQANATKYTLDEDAVKDCRLTMNNFLFVSEGGLKKTHNVKINHSYLDKKAFESVINGEMALEDKWEKYLNLPEEDSSSAIFKCYAFFRDELEDCSQETIDYLWELLTVDKVKFLVNIDLAPNDNEQAIFDTVNSAGVRLSSADTIKNLLYQKYVELLRKTMTSSIDEEAVSKYESTWVDAFISDEKVNAYWETTRQYGRMKRSNLETFLHAFAVIKGFFNPAENNMSDLPQGYRVKINEMNIDELDRFLNDLHDYADVYRDYFSEGDAVLSYEDYVGKIFNICSVLEVSTFYPYLLQQLYSRKIEAISDEELRDRFFGIERYVILNAICKGSNKNYNNECVQLVGGKRKPQELMDNCVYISEDNFKNGLRRMTTNKLPTLILFWVELYLRNSLSVDVKSLKYEYTLEHIMPQKWEQNWSDVTCYDKDGNIAEDIDEIDRLRSHAIYEIGNMTLLNSKLNTSISNGTFYDKVNGKNGKNGIKSLADLKLTKDVILNNNEWNELKIYQRTTYLEKIIREIWNAEELPKEVKVLKSSSENSSMRHEIRMEFWEYALPVIREANNNEAFVYVTPSKNNSVSGSTGIGGFAVWCAANYDKARVDFVFGKRATSDNKRAYDIAYSHREEIEEQLGAKLNWDRADDYVSSWTSIYLNGVSILNKDDWKKMADFHAEWSSKFRRVITPYLIDEFSVESSERTPEEVARLENIAAILREWMANNEFVNDCPENSNRTCTRFKTERMSNIIPDTPGLLSSWTTPNHYFYEIVNRTGKDVVLQLSYNSKNISNEQREICNKINEFTPMHQAKADWVWWKAFKASKVMVPENLDKEIIFKGMDKALEEVFAFEEMLTSKLGEV